MQQDDWHGCYSDGWKSLCPESFAHPAKVSFSLAERIYEHIVAEGWVKPGDTVLDPFAGIGGFALHALVNDLNFVGVELEQNFVDMAAGCECTGISPADWVRFYGRWKRAAHLGGRHWCPRCVAEAGNVLDDTSGRWPLPLPGSGYEPKPKAEQASFFDRAETATYKRNSGRVPFTTAHHYTGNAELFQRLARNGATAAVVQGDSRQLASIVGGAAVACSSPPYGNNTVHGNGGIDAEKLTDGRHNPPGKHSQALVMDGYGDAPGQLNAMPEGSHAAVVSSPPYADGCRHTGGDDPKPEHVQGGKLYGVGIAGAVSSPPYAESLASDDPDRRGGLYRDPKRRNDKTLTAEYGRTAGQLGAMAVSSPPFEDQLHQSKGGMLAPHQSHEHGRNENAPSVLAREYGNTDGNIGNTTGLDFWSAARQIVQQLALVLRPGAHAVFVCKRFVRDGAIVDFSQQWADLCEACGFEVVHWHRAWLIEERGKQYTLGGGLEEKQVKRCSFFRRLYESKYPENSIDWEDVICMVRR